MAEDTTLRMKWFMLVSTTLAVFGIVVLLFYKDIPDMVAGTLLTVVGLIVSKWGTIADFLFGSSSGSAKKTDMLSDIATGTGDGKSTTTVTAKTDIQRTITTEPPKTETITTTEPPNKEGTV